MQCKDTFLLPNSRNFLFVCTLFLASSTSLQYDVLYKIAEKTKKISPLSKKFVSLQSLRRRRKVFFLNINFALSATRKDAGVVELARLESE